MTCEKCGVELSVGDWPFCGKGGHGRSFSGVIPDDIPGGMTIENMSDQPETFYTRSEHRRRMKELGIEPLVRHIQGSKVTTNWSTVDPQTIENARFLVTERIGSKTTTADRDPNVEAWKSLLKDTHDRLSSSRYESVITRGGIVSADMLHESSK